ncbi:T9SS type A sorting domain-containing protein [Flavobacterium sp.]|uniref:T9SS type A sorting domain-containing protein n=1 Tax=Flavobacterium sp. TaxID=239 RepID=UPI001B590F66|nr:T9SS type A sorting domain-containing protein [Flavobacterium sp.]MBP6183141.1 T9SS type A sorting domain-containing protein [Flavobacterium sp.]
MKKIYTSILTIYTTLTFAQINTVQVVGSAGNTARSGNTLLTWTIGEPIVNTATTTNNVLTQGFNQGLLLITAIDELKNTTISIQPNPTSDFVIIKLDDQNLINAQYTLTDINGKVIQQNKIENKQTSVSFQDLANTTYFIQVSTNNQKAKTFKIIKN